MFSLTTRTQLDRAAKHVQRELQHLGLWHERSRLCTADIRWCTIPNVRMLLAQGYFIHVDSATRVLGYEQGHIYIPSVVLGRRNLRDVIRHEYGHAVAHYYPTLVRRSRRFTATFGGIYDSGTPAGSQDPADYLSDYAASEPAEDFAETFMIYVRRRGTPRPQWTKAVTQKWRHVAEVIERIANA